MSFLQLLFFSIIRKNPCLMSIDIYPGGVYNKNRKNNCEVKDERGFLLLPKNKRAF